MVEIRRYQAGDAEAFRDLNVAWIAQYFAMEDVDRAVLDDPEGHILERGGQIFMATLDGEPVGCCALILTHPGTFEVAKMAVKEGHRGLGIGRKLLERAVEEARLGGARSLSLEPNTKLASAVHLYESVGFRHLPPEKVQPSIYARANVFMEMEF
jgi:putative acetyltransferase